LSKLSGPQFDKEFIDVMVREHRNALQVFEHEANRNPSSQDSTVARELLPQLRQHLTETEQIQRQLQSSNIR
jgi:predicted outer membrane protein